MHVQRQDNFSRIWLLKGALAIACAAYCAYGTFAPAHAPYTKVVIVRSKEVEPFKQAEAAFTQALASDAQVESLSLAEATPQMLSKSAGDAQTAFFAIGTEAAEVVKQSITPTSLFTCAMVSDPASLGIFGTRTTTVVSMETPLPEQMTLIATALPTVRKLGVLYNSETPRGRRAIESLRAALPRGWSIDAVAVNHEASVADAVTKLFGATPDLIWTYPDSSLYDVATIKSILLESLRKNVPVFGFSAAFVRAGAIIGIGTTPLDQGRQAARALGRGLEDTTRDNSIPIAPELKTYVNTVVADRLGIVIPPQVIQSAAAVFKGD